MITKKENIVENAPQFPSIWRKIEKFSVHQVVEENGASAEKINKNPTVKIQGQETEVGSEEGNIKQWG